MTYGLLGRSFRSFEEASDFFDGAGFELVKMTEHMYDVIPENRPENYPRHHGTKNPVGVGLLYNFPDMADGIIFIGGNGSNPVVERYHEKLRPLLEADGCNA